LVVLFFTCSTGAADEIEGFLVPHDGAPRFLGPLGGEGNTAEIFATRKQTGGVFGVWRYTAEPKFGPPLHIHKEEDEFFYVLSGEFAFQLGDCVKVAKAGSFAFIPKNAPHTYKNLGTETGVLLGAVTPGGFEAFFEKLPGVDEAKLAALAEDHAMDAVGPEIDIAGLSPRLKPSPSSQTAAKVYRVGVLAPGCDPPSSVIETLFNSLRDLGYVEGHNLEIEWRYSEGKAERFPELANELVNLDVDLIVAMSTPAALAAKKATSNVPTVMVYVADPVGTGLVASLAKPGGNITGVSDMATKLSAKRLALLKEMIPTVDRLAVLWNVSDPGMVLRFKEITLQSLEVRSHAEFGNAFAAMTRERPDALFVIAEVLTIAHRCQILNFANNLGIPAMYEFGLFALDGGLMAYGPKLTDSFQRGAYYVDKILKGARPADLPVEQPMKIELAINLNTAKTLGITIPPSVLFQADQIDKGSNNQCLRIW
jgi:putative ABC transport system substrate-binding protein